jgi:hypothetical protein
VLERGYERALATALAWLDGIEGLLAFGRQGLFAHDNVHHALSVGYGAADCLRPDGRFDRGRWGALRQVFESHVVED